MAEGHVRDIISMTDFTEDEVKELRLVLLGKTGAGKSATGNSIIGNKVFASQASQTSITGTCQSYQVEKYNKKITVVDTPGFFDTSRSIDDLKMEILNFFVEAAPGPHAFIIVLSMARFTDEEERVMNQIKQLFGDLVFDYSILLFPKADDLIADNVLFTDFVNRSPSALKDLFAKCGKRVISFNNRANQTENEKQVKRLIELVGEIVKGNGGKCYTNEIFQDIQREIERKQQEEEENRKKKRQEIMSSIEQKAEQIFANKMRKDKEKLEFNNIMINQLDLTLHSSTDPEILEELRGKIDKLREENEVLSQRLLEDEKEKLKLIQKEKEELEKEFKSKISTQQKAKDEVKSTFQKVKEGVMDASNLLVLGRIVYIMGKGFLGLP